MFSGVNMGGDAECSETDVVHVVDASYLVIFASMARAATPATGQTTPQQTTRRSRATAPVLRLVESEEVFRREVINRHTPLHTQTGTRQTGHPDQDPRAVAAERAWLASLTHPADSGTAADAEADENGNVR